MLRIMNEEKVLSTLVSLVGDPPLKHNHREKCYYLSAILAAAGHVRAFAYILAPPEARAAAKSFAIDFAKRSQFFAH